jgi:hypothetical protein
MIPQVPARRGSITLVALVIAVAVALLLPVAAMAATPTVTIVGPGHISATPPPTAAVPAVNDAYVQLYLQNHEWGADYVRFSNDAGTTWSSGTSWSEYLNWYMYQDLGDVGLMIDGVHTVTAQFSNDGGTTWGPTATATTLVDEQSPVVTAPEGYWNSRHPYTLRSHDQIGLSGIQFLWYRIDTGDLVKLTNASPLGTSDPLNVSFDLAGPTGTAHSIDYIAKDYAGNYSGIRLRNGARAALRGVSIANLAYSAYVVIDRTRPKAKARGADDKWHHAPVTISFSASDDTSGVDRIEYSVTGVKAKKHAAWTSGNSVAVTQSGRHKVWYRAIDKALPKGNASNAKFVIVKIR